MLLRGDRSSMNLLRKLKAGTKRIRARRAAQRQPLFDEVYYRWMTPDLSLYRSARKHYAKVGQKERRRPHPLFDPKSYLERYPQVERAGIEPALHYFTVGALEGYQASPLFDERYYFDTYPDVAANGANPLLHYVNHGWKERRDPASWFSTRWYLQRHPELEGKDICPLVHFACVGWQTGSKPSPHFRWASCSETLKAELSALPRILHYGMGHDRINEWPSPNESARKLFDATWYASRGGANVGAEEYFNGRWRDGIPPHPLFDAAWYLATNPDIQEAGLEPLTHFLAAGWREGRRPIPTFDVDHYLDCYPEAGRHPGGPLLHYVESGSNQGFSPNILFDPSWYRAANPGLDESTDAFSHYSNGGWRAGGKPHPCFDPTWYRQQIGLNEPAEPDIAHYETVGYLQSASPHPGIDEAWYQSSYLTLHSEAALKHYLREGRIFNHCPHPLFDEEYYKSQLSDKLVAGLDHYIRAGEAADLKPNQLFSARQYVMLNKNIVPKAASPFFHLVIEGDESHLSPSVSFSSVRYHSRYLSYSEHRRPLRHYMLEGRHKGFNPSMAARDVQATPLLWLTQRDEKAASYSNGRAPNTARESTQRLKFPKLIAILGAHDTEIDRKFKHYLSKQIEQDQIEIICIATLKDIWDVIHLRPPHEQRRIITFIDSKCLATFGDINNVMDALAAAPDNVMAFPTTLNLRGDVWSAGLEIRDGKASPRHVGGDPDHPEVRVAHTNLLANGPVFSIWLDALPPANDPIWENNNVADFAFSLSCRFHEAGRNIKFVAVAQVLNLADKRPATHVTSALLTRRASREKLLFIDSLISMPDRDAGSFYALSLMQMYRSWGYDITFCPDADYFPDEVYVRALEAEHVRVMQAPFVCATADFIEHSDENFDVVIMSRIYSGGAHMERLRRRWPDAKLIFHPGDLHYLREQREAVINDDIEGFSHSIATRKRELAIIEESDATILVSDYELNELRNRGVSDKAYVVAPEYHGESSSFYDPLARKSVCFIGGYRHAPNIDAADFLMRDVWPLVLARNPNIELDIVGSDPPAHFAELATAGVNLIGFVPSISEYLSRVRFSLASVRYGAGIKLKMIASLDAGVPVIATSVAAEGIGLKQGEGYLIADDPVETADLIASLYDDLERLNALSEAGIAAVRERYSPKAVHAHYARVLDTVLGRTDADTREAP